MRFLPELLVYWLTKDAHYIQDATAHVHNFWTVHDMTPVLLRLSRHSITGCRTLKDNAVVGFRENSAFR
jgi:hypothetical protein